MLQAIKCHLGLVSESLCHPGLPDAKNAANRIWLKETLSDDGSSNLFSTSSQTHIYPVSRYTNAICVSWSWANQWSISVAQHQLQTNILNIFVYIITEKLLSLPSRRADRTPTADAELIARRLQTTWGLCSLYTATCCLASQTTTNQLCSCSNHKHTRVKLLQLYIWYAWAWQKIVL